MQWDTLRTMLRRITYFEAMVFDERVRNEKSGKSLSTVHGYREMYRNQTVLPDNRLTVATSLLVVVDNSTSNTLT